VVTKILITVALAGALGLFARRAIQLLAMLRLGKPDKRWDNIGARIGRELRVVWGQQKLLQWPFPGIMHAFIFWGFVILFTTIVEAFGTAYSSSFALPLVGHWGPLAALQDTFAGLVLVGIAMAFFIRKRLRPGRFRGSPLKEADRILIAISGIMLTARLETGEANIGATMPLESIAACVIGGVSLRGGSGRLGNVVLGAIFIGMVQNGMNLARMESYLQTVVIGVLLIAAVIADQLRQRFMAQLRD